MEGEQESSVSTSASSSTEASKVKPQPWSELVKELYFTPSEDKLALFEKNYRLLYNAVTSISEKLKEIKKIMIKYLQRKSTQTNIKINFNVKPDDILTQIFEHLDLKKQELQAIKEKIETQIVEAEVHDKEMDLLKARLSRNEKSVSQLKQDIRTWRAKFDEQIASVTSLGEIQRKNDFLLQATTKLNQLRKMGSQMRVVILEYISLTAPIDEGNNLPHTLKTKEEHEVEIMRGKLKKILDELLMFAGEPRTSGFSDE